MSVNHCLVPAEKDVKVPSGFEGNIIHQCIIRFDVFNYDKHVFGNLNYPSLYTVKSSVDVLLGAEYNLATAPFYYFRCTLSENGDLEPCRFTWYVNFPPRASLLSILLRYSAVQDPNPAVTLANFSVDVSSQRQISVYSNTSNYIYLRGNATSPGSGRVRLFYVPGQILIHPSLYTQPSHVVFDVDENNDPVTAYRRYSTTGAQPIVVTRPFTLNNLPPDHYCCIAECLPDGETQWPHEKVSNFGTGDEFVAWLLNEPCVAWRNLNWEQNPRPDSQTLQTSFTIPRSFF